MYTIELKFHVGQKVFARIEGKIKEDIVGGYFIEKCPNKKDRLSYYLENHFDQIEDKRIYWLVDESKLSDNIDDLKIDGNNMII